jgi:hypothetical protein
LNRGDHDVGIGIHCSSDKKWLRKSTTPIKCTRSDSTIQTIKREISSATQPLRRWSGWTKNEIEACLQRTRRAHNAAMECYRRAMIGDQTFEEPKPNEQAWPHDPHCAPNKNLKTGKPTDAGRA